VGHVADEKLSRTHDQLPTRVKPSNVLSGI
jgi:hypothetical protein